ncbi:MAG: DUF29 domain-containing protein [Cytophagaceae bacterium]|nr:DUF29 domain-containing protein [Cytophagaceae bacterium]
MTTRSQLDTVEVIRQLVEEEEYEEALQGLDELYDTMSKSEKRALGSQLARLMAHILKWKYSPEKRSMSWVKTIASARFEIRKIQEFTPSLNETYIHSVWNDCFEDGIDLAKAEMGLSRKDKFDPAPLTWQDVFDEDYILLHA